MYRDLKVRIMVRSNIDRRILNCERRMCLPCSAEPDDSERVEPDNSGMSMEGGESERGVEGTEVGRL